MTKFAVSLEDVRAAATRIACRIHRTPVLTCSMLNREAGREVFLKCENLQKVGAFKFRGASNAVAMLDPRAARKGVVTHSSGNHAQALALAACSQGIPAHIVMPSNASRVKRQAVEGYGARVVECEPTLIARETTAAALVAETGATLIPPYDHPDIIAGQGTAGLELQEQVSGLDAIVAPVGGGGLLAGVAVAVKGMVPGIQVFGAEPAGADDAARSVAAGVLIPQLGPQTIADGLLTSLGSYTWPIIRDLVDGIITVTDEEIVHAMRLIWERAKIVIEPSAAVAVAAVLNSTFPQRTSAARVGVILSGGNVDLDKLPW